MTHQALFGIVSEAGDEKTIHENVKKYLATFHRTTSTVKRPDQLTKFLPFKLKHYHWNLNKETGTFLSLYPNRDLENKLLVGARPDFGWLVHVLYHHDYPGYEKEKSASFVLGLLEATGFKYERLLETDGASENIFGLEK